MQRILYAGGEVLTGSAIAEVLLKYARALGETNGSAIVRIPSRLEDGTTGSAEFLIGPASQLMSKSEPAHDGDEIVDDELVAHFRTETALLAAPNAVPIDGEARGPSGIDDFDFPTT